MATGKFIAYYRVSTGKQRISGLGLEAQRNAVADYLNGGRWTLLEEYTEVESGKNSDRPQLARALASRRVHKATPVVAPSWTVLRVTCISFLVLWKLEWTL